MAIEKNIQQFFTAYLEMAALQQQLEPFSYLERLDEDFIYSNYLTSWPLETKLVDKTLSTDEKVTLLNINLRFSHHLISQLHPQDERRVPALLPVEESLRNQFEHLSKKVKESEDKLKSITADKDGAKKFEELEARIL